MAIEIDTPLASLRDTPVFFEDMGRPLLGDWLVDFEEVFLDKARGLGIGLELRHTPGVIYAQGRFLRKYFRENPLVPEVVDTNDAIERFVGKGIFEKRVALDSLRVVVREIDTKLIRKDRKTAVVRARVGDIRCSSYNGFAISGEKKVTQQELGLELDQPKPDRVPKHHLVLGTLSFTGGFTNTDILEEVRKSLESMVTLGPIGEVNASSQYKD